jgi:hypothetical protein
MSPILRKRRILAFFILLLSLIFIIIGNSPNSVEVNRPIGNIDKIVTSPAKDALDRLIVRDSAMQADYSRDKFGSDWISVGGCDTRNIILNRDLVDTAVNDKCEVVSGKLADPYTGRAINFKRGADTSGDIQIDHVVALADAWRTGAWQMTSTERLKLANDPLELLAVDGKANMEKSDGDASAWLPSNKPFRCQYVSRQIAVKQKYSLWVTQSEKDSINGVLSKCPGQMLPSP